MSPLQVCRLLCAASATGSPVDVSVLSGLPTQSSAASARLMGYGPFWVLACWGWSPSPARSPSLASVSTSSDSVVRLSAVPPPPSSVLALVAVALQRPLPAWPRPLPSLGPMGLGLRWAVCAVRLAVPFDFSRSFFPCSFECCGCRPGSFFSVHASPQEDSSESSSSFSSQFQSLPGCPHSP